MILEHYFTLAVVLSSARYILEIGASYFLRQVILTLPSHWPVKTLGKPKVLIRCWVA